MLDHTEPVKGIDDLDLIAASMGIDIVNEILRELEDAFLTFFSA